MGPRLLCFIGGALLTAFFVFQGLLATPFFGSGAFLWASVFASFLLALALGYGLGDLVAAAAGRRSLNMAAPRLAVAGGLGAWLFAYLLPVICRAVLDRDPDWTLAPTVSMVLSTLLPGALLAGIVPSELRARLAGADGGGRAGGAGRGGESPLDSTDGEGGTTTATDVLHSGAHDSRQAARSALRLLGLMTLGGVAGVALTAKPLLRADEVDVWKYAYGSGALLALLGLSFLKPLGRLVGVLLLGGLVALAALVPSEVQTQEYAVALESAWEARKGGSLYYRRTAVEERLSDEEIAAHYAHLAKESGAEKPGIILTCELLAAIGEVDGISGEGLLRTLELFLSPEAKPFIMPIFEQVDSIQSRQGLLSVAIKRERGVEGARFHIPGEQPGKKVRFWFRDDFTIRLVHEKHTWKLEFGPLTVKKAGIFELNDTHSTPIRIENVALWVDASLLGIVLEDYPDQVVVKAVAQGDIGDVQTVEVIAIPKEKASK